MRVLFAFAGGQGHLDPLVPLARAAEEAGHDVAVTGRAELLGVIEERGFVAPERALREWYAGTLARRRAEALTDLAREWDRARSSTTRSTTARGSPPSGSGCRAPACS
jgi:UDP:flavonoid glycosyltransferase YjiC (YdhE family)